MEMDIEGWRGRGPFGFRVAPQINRYHQIPTNKAHEKDPGVLSAIQGSDALDPLSSHLLCIQVKHILNNGPIFLPSLVASLLLQDVDREI